MSSENVEIVRELVDSWRRREHERAFAFYDPDIVWDVSAWGALPDAPAVYHGHDGVRDWWRRWLAAWEDVSIGEAELIDAGDRVLLLLSNQRARGRGSGVELRLDNGFLWTFRDGKVIEVQVFKGHGAARRAAGLDQ